MFRKILKWTSLALVSLIVLAVCTALLYRKYLQHERADARAIHTPNGINSLEAVQINGINQWVQVRGQDVNNPILLWIHGGPGIAFIPLSADFQDPWEKYFTVVEWDQRGAGKTLASNDSDLQRRTWNVPQMEADTLAVVNYLRNRFNRQKIFVIGHSWGSVLGLWLAHEHPDLLYAYVGTGQVTNFAQNEKAAYDDALQQARTNHNAHAIKDLEAIAPYPRPNLSDDAVGVAKGWEQRLLGPPPGVPDFTDGSRIIKTLVSTPEYSLLDDVDFIRGMNVSREILPEVMPIDLTQLGPDFQTPVFFFEGKYDPYCRASLISDYFQTIHDRRKQLVWFDRSGHFPFFEEPQKFTDSLVHLVLPLASAH